MRKKILKGKENEILKLYYEKKWSCRKIAKKYGASVSTVRRYIVNLGRKLRKPGTYDRHRSFWSKIFG